MMLVNENTEPAATDRESGPHVLIVDDDVHLLTALTRGLKPHGFVVQTARESGTALDIVDSGWPQVMLLDIMMPGLDGLHLCRIVRQKEITLPILMLTAMDSVPDRVAGFEAGADDYLVKPFALDELIVRIRALLRRQGGVAAKAGARAYSGIVLDSTT